MYLLIGLRSIRHDHARRRRVQPAFQQFRCDLAVILPRHVYRVGRIFQRHVIPFGRNVPRGVMAQKNQFRSIPTVRQRNLCRRRRAHRRSHAGNHFKLDSRARQRFHLFAHAPKQQGVAALQTHHLLAFARRGDQQLVNLFLRNSRLPAAFPHVAHLRPRGN